MPATLIKSEVDFEADGRRHGFLRLPHSVPERAKLLALQEAFDTPCARVFTSDGGRNTASRTSMGAAGRKGVITVNTELGGGGTVSRTILAMTERGDCLYQIAADARKADQ